MGFSDRFEDPPIAFMAISVAVCTLVLSIFVLLPIDLPRTWADQWIESALYEKLGISEEEYAILIQLYEKQVDDKQNSLSTKLKIQNIGKQSFGSSDRRWQISFKSNGNSSLKIDATAVINKKSDDIVVSFVDSGINASAAMEFGLFYPGEWVEVQVKHNNSVSDLIKDVRVETNLPINPKITITKYGIDEESESDFANIILYSLVGIIGIILSIFGFGLFNELREKGAYFINTYMGLITILGVISLTIIYSVTLIKIILLVYWLAMLPFG